MKTITEMMAGAGSGYMRGPSYGNYPGFDLISGKDLLEKMRKQVENVFHKEHGRSQRNYKNDWVCYCQTLKAHIN